DQDHQQGDDDTFQDHQRDHVAFPHTAGVSPADPNWNVWLAPPDDRLWRRCHVPSWNQPGRSTPAPCQSPATGMPPGPKSKVLIEPPSVVRSRQVVPRTIPGRARPSSVHRPTTGMSPGSPNVKSRSGGPPELELRKIQRFPRTTPGVATPSPSQSPTTGMSPAW